MVEPCVGREKRPGYKAWLHNLSLWDPMSPFPAGPQLSHLYGEIVYPTYGWVYLLLCLALCPLLSRAGNRQDPLRGMWAVMEGGPGAAGAQQVWGDF